MARQRLRRNGAARRSLPRARPIRRARHRLPPREGNGSSDGRDPHDGFRCPGCTPNADRAGSRSRRGMSRARRVIERRIYRDRMSADVVRSAMPLCERVDSGSYGAALGRGGNALPPGSSVHRFGGQNSPTTRIPSPERRVDDATSEADEPRCSPARSHQIAPRLAPTRQENGTRNTRSAVSEKDGISRGGRIRYRRLSPRYPSPASVVRCATCLTAAARARRRR